MQDFVGEECSLVKEKLEKMGFSTTVVGNNHNVSGTKLVTNVTYKDNTAIITVGEFILEI